MDTSRKINTERLAEDIEQLNLYANDESLKLFVSKLEALYQAPESQEALDDFFKTFDTLGLSQGIVLTYAPYSKVLLSEAMNTDAFGEYTDEDFQGGY